MTKYAAEGSWDAVKGLLPSGTTIEGTPLGQQLRNLLGAGGRLLQRNAQPIMQAGIGAGLLGLGKATHNQVLGGLGGATLGNLPGRMMGTYFGNQGEVQMPHGLETPDASFWTNNPIEYRNKGGLVGALAGGGLGYAATKATGLDKIKDTVRSLPDRLNPGNWTPENQRALAQGGLGAAALGAGRLTDNRALGAIGGGLLGNAAGGALDRNSDYGGHAGEVFGTALGAGLGARKRPEPEQKEAAFSLQLGSHYAQGYADALTKLGFANMLAPLAGALAGPGIRAGLGKVAPRMAGKLSGPIRSGVFDAVAGQAAGSLMSPSAPPAPG